ncbi:hypothetical protein P4O66_000100 [Electrophorus voltai]|uniref:Uncharacterized protein n=1 Tax=Electrophorus voltai TaxID=2609070 RepID=A0AAD8ZVU0_9TELE|nr:hypothetical protein P4O66_000100 [Electrophorus voltai]
MERPWQLVVVRVPRQFKLSSESGAKQSCGWDGRGGVFAPAKLPGRPHAQARVRRQDEGAAEQVDHSTSLSLHSPPLFSSTGDSRKGLDTGLPRGQ